MLQIDRRTPMSKCDFAALQLYGNQTSAWVFSCQLLHIFRTPFPGNNSGGLLQWTYIPFSWRQSPDKQSPRNLKPFKNNPFVERISLITFFLCVITTFLVSVFIFCILKTPETKAFQVFDQNK